MLPTSSAEDKQIVTKGLSWKQTDKKYPSMPMYSQYMPNTFGSIASLAQEYQQRFPGLQKTGSAFLCSDWQTYGSSRACLPKDYTGIPRLQRCTNEITVFCNSFFLIFFPFHRLKSIFQSLITKIVLVYSYWFFNYTLVYSDTTREIFYHLYLEKEENGTTLLEQFSSK